MITVFLGAFCALLGWALGWIHSIYWEKKDREALLEECVTLGLEIEALRKHQEDSLAARTASPRAARSEQSPIPEP
jgi:hypothetical protein